MKKAIKLVYILIWTFSLLIIALSIIYLFAGRTALSRAYPENNNWIDVKKVLSTLALTLDGIVSNSRGLKNYPVPILMYHYVRQVNQEDDPLGYNLSVTPQTLDEHLKNFAIAGFKTISLEEFLSGKFDSNAIILTFDDGYRDFYIQAYPLLKKYQFKATVFVVSGFTDKKDAYLSSSQIQALAANGIEIGSHSISHANLTNLDEHKLTRELSESRLTLEKLIGKPVVSLAFPSGQYNEEVIKIAKKVGYLTGVTTDNGTARLKSNRLALPRLRVGGDESADSIIARIKKAKQDITDEASPVDDEPTKVKSQPAQESTN